MDEAVFDTAIYTVMLTIWRMLEMKILESKFVQGFIKMANDGYQQGWHERNGGNLSYRLKPEEVEMIKPRLNAPGEWEPIGTEVPGLAG